MSSNIELNPYAPPSSPGTVRPRPQVARVDGKCIVVTNGCELPLRCFDTNANCELSDQKLRKFNYAPSFRLVMSHRVCHLYICVSAPRRMLDWSFRVIAFVGMLVGMLVFTGAVVVAVLSALAVACSLRTDSLKVVNYEKGEFWIRGCSDDFLDSLVTEDGWQRV